MIKPDPPPSPHWVLVPGVVNSMSYWEVACGG